MSTMEKERRVDSLEEESQSAEDTQPIRRRGDKKKKSRKSRQREQPQNQELQQQGQQGQQGGGPLGGLPVGGDALGGVQNTVGGVTGGLLGGSQQESGGGGSGKSDTLRLRLDLNLEIEIQLKARIHGDLELALLLASSIMEHSISYDVPPTKHFCSVKVLSREAKRRWTV
ncbi:hypothetical protein S7711_06926 [Stachybotrys chartarum IBT 7711]|uniref:Uncharacterized protein n=1 Tax=Stachybotrys chartarum (strain CBS 109288 / IBT 7711) TaxID=1280523 RepID=A0A084AL39_STACB|nr:hypothetical protein S7711_06926 [Stachybotrys chartarum IBT 7711]